jgi:ankyrin repeat protein
MKNILYSLIAVLLIALLQSGNHDCHAAGSEALRKETEIKLIEFIHNDEHDTIESLLKSLPDINFKDRKGFTPLMAAAEFGDSSAVRLLIKRGAEVNAVNGLGKTALILSANYGFLDNARELISAGADIDARDDIFKMSAFLYSVKFGFIEMAKLLVDSKADIRALDCFGNNALALAVRHNNAEMVRYLIGLKFDPNGLMIEKEGETLLMYAAGKGMYDIVKLLIESGADVNKKTVYGFSALVYAAVCGVERVEDLIVEKSSGLDGEQGTYALGIAVLFENNSMIEKLIKKGADPDKVYRTVQSESFYGADPVNGLVEKIINNGVVAGRDYSPLMIACVTGNLRAVKKLVECGAGIDRVEEGCHTPLMAALNFENFDIARFLIERGANVNAKNLRGETPLALAAYLKNYEIAKLLIERGARVDEPAGRGPNAAMIALNSGDEKLLKLFTDKGIDVAKLVNSVSGRFNSPLQNAIDSENIPLIKTIMKLGVNPNQRFDFGQTPLSLAARGGNYEAVKVLIDSGAGVNYTISENSSDTALDVAAGEGMDEIVKLLLERGHTFDKAKIERPGQSNYRSKSVTADETRLKKNIFYSRNPWNLKEFPAGIRKIINDTHGFKNRLENGEIVRETLPVALKENIDITGSSQMTALQHFTGMLEISAKNNLVIKLLLDNKADLYAGKDGRNSLKSIIEKGNREIYDYLIEKGFELKIDEKDISRMIISLAGAVGNPDASESMKILLDIAHRKNFLLAGDEETIKTVMRSSNINAIKYLFDKKLLGMQSSGTHAIELCLSEEKDGYRSYRLTNAFYLAKLSAIPCSEIVNFFKKNKISSSEEILIAAVSAKNVECIRHFSKNLKSEDYRVANIFLDAIVYARQEGTPEAELLKVALEVVENPELKIDNERKTRALYKLIPHMINAKLNERVKSFLSKYGFDDENLNRLMIGASASSNNYEMNRFLMMNLPLMDKAVLTERLLRSDSDRDMNKERRGEEKKDRKQYSAVLESITPDSFNKFQAAFNASDRSEFSAFDIRNLFGKALESGNDKIAKYLIDKETDFYDKFYVETAVSRERFDLADHAISKGAKIDHADVCYFDAVRDNKPAAIDYLLKIKADPNLRFIGEVPLAMALKNGQTDIFIKLAEGGADLVKGRFKENSGNYFGLRGKFSFSGMETWVRPDNDSTLLNYAIAKAQRRAALFLASREPGINVVEPSSGKCALELAIGRNLTGVALEILKRGDLDLKSESIKKSMTDAIETGNAPVIKRLVEMGVPVCADFKPETLKSLIRDKKESSYAIIGAMTAKNIAAGDILNSLLSSGASTTEILTGSIKMQNIVLTRAFLAAGNGDGVSGGGGSQALITAVECGNSDAVELLLKSGADPNTVDVFRTPLSVVASMNGRIDILKALVDCGADINAASPFGVDALYASLYRGNAAVLNYLISKKSKTSNSLIKSVENLETAFVLKLLEKGASPNACDSKGVNALHLARQTLQYDIEEMLLKYNADPNYEPENLPALKIFDIIEKSGNEKYAVELISKVKNLEEKNDAGDTLLLAALKRWNMQELPLALVRAGADLSAADASKTTALMYLLKKNFSGLNFANIIAKARNINATNCAAENILFFYEGRKTEEVDLLLRSGADIGQTNYEGMTPFLRFINDRRIHLAEFLIRRGADVCVRNRRGVNALMLMSQKCSGMTYEWKKLSEDIMDALIAKMKNNINDLDENGETAVMMAAKSSLPYFVKSLIKAGADVNIKNAAGDTALIMACDQESAAALIEAGADTGLGVKGFDDSEAVKRLLSNKYGEKNFGALKVILDGNIDKAAAVDEKLSGVFLQAGISNGLKSLIYIASKNKTQQDKFFDMLFNNFKIGEEIVWKSLLEAGSGAQLKCLSGMGRIIKLSGGGWEEIGSVIKAGNTDILPSLLQHRKRFDKKTLVDAIPVALYYNRKAAARELIMNLDTLEDSVVSRLCYEYGQSNDTEGIALIFKRGSGSEANADLKLKIFLQCSASLKNDMALSIFESDPKFFNNAKSPDGLPLFVYVCKSRNVELARAMLKAAADPDVKGPMGRSALYYAAFNGDMQMIKFIEESGADLGIKNDKDSIAIICAANGGSLEAVKFFQMKGQSLNYKNKFGLTPLIVSLMAEKKEIAKYLINSGVEVNCVYDEANYGRVTPLIAAVKMGDVEIIKTLIEKGADLNEKSDYGTTADLVLKASVKKNLPELIKLLIDKGIDIDRLDNVGFNVLHTAVEAGKIEMVKFIVSTGSGIDSKNRHGETALRVALRTRNSEIARYLYSMGASVQISDAIAKLVSFENALTCGCDEIALDIISKSGKDLIFLPLLIKFKKIDEVKKYVESEAGAGLKVGDTPLISFAAGEGALEIMKYMAGKNSGIETKSPDGRTPLLHAAGGGDIASIKFLVEKGAEINARDNDRNSAILLAAARGKVEAVKYFKEKGQNVNHKNKNGLTPLIAACMAGSVETLKYLLTSGASAEGYYANPKDSPGGALFYAVKSKNAEIVRLLIENKADLKSFEAVEALCESLSNYSENDIYRMLIDGGVDLNKSSDYSDYPIYYGVKFRKNNPVKYLIQKGARFDLSENKAQKTIEFEKQYRNAEIFTLLRKASDSIIKNPELKKTGELNKLIFAGEEAGAVKFLADSCEINLRDERYNTPLINAVETGSVGLVKILLERGADPNISGSRDLRPLTLAVKSKKIEIVRLLIEKGADINYTDCRNTLPLVLAVIQGSADIFEYLITRGAKINIRSLDGHTPLTAAAAYDRTEMVKTLIEKGADLNVRSYSDDTALALTVANDNDAAVDLLRRTGASSIGDRNEREYFELCQAISNGTTAEIITIIKKGANVNCTVKNFAPPLIKAVRKGKIDAAKLLIENGADAGVRDASGKSVLDYYLACSYGKYDEKFFSFISNFMVSDQLKERILFSCDGKNPQLAMKLISRSEALKIFGDLGRNWLMTAIASEKFNIAIELIKIGSDVKLKDKKGMNSLMLICNSYSGNEIYKKGIALMLLNGGLSINDQDAEGNTALHYALRSSLDYMVSFLVDRGAGVNIKNKKGESPFIMVKCINYYPELLSKMVSAGAEIFPADDDYPPADSVKMLASISEPAMMKILLDRYLDKNKNPDAAIIGHILKIEPVKGLAAAIYISQKKCLNPESAYNKYFYKAELSFPQVIKTLIELGNVEYLRFFRKKGLKLASKEYSGLELKFALKCRNYEAAAMILEDGRTFASVINQVVESAAAANDRRAVKLVLSRATAEIEVKIVNSLLEKFIESCDIEGINILAGRKKTDAEKRDFIEKTLNAIIESKNAPEKFFTEVFESSADAGEKKLESAAGSFMQKAFDNKKFEIIYYLEKIFKGDKKIYNSYSLVIAAAAGNIDAVKKLLENGAAPDSIDELGNYAIQRAIDNLKLDVMKLIVEKGASLKSTTGIKAMSSAIAAGSAEAVSYLIKKGADPNASSSPGRSHLQAAVLLNRPDILKSLIDGGAYFDAASPSGKALFETAAKNADGKLLKILEKGPSSEIVNKVEPSVKLNECIKSGNLKDAAALMNAVNFINYKDDSGNTLLNNAITFRRLEIAKTLIEKGADLNERNSEGRTPLMTAALSGNDALVKILVEKGADLTVKDENGYDALSWSILCDDDVSCSHILSRIGGQGCDLKILPVHRKNAEERKNLEIIELLIEYTPQETPPGKSFVEKRRLAEELTKAALAGDTVSVALMLKDSSPQKVNQGKLICLVKKTAAAKMPEMTELLAKHLSECQKIISDILFMNDMDERQMKIAETLMRSLPERAFENDANNLAMEFIRSKNLKCLDILLGKGMKYIKSFELSFLLIDPAVTSNKDILKLFLKRMNNFREPACAGFFCDALKRGDKESAKICLGMKFDFNESEFMNYSEILKSIGRYGDPAFIEAASKNIDMGKFGFNIFGEAFRAGRIDNMQQLVELGVKIDKPDRQHILGEALDSENYAAAIFMINNGVDPDFRDRGGLNALMHAAMTDEIELAETALEKGANIALTNETGETALDIARAFKSRGVEKIIENSKSAKNELVNDVYRLMGMLRDETNEAGIVEIIKAGYKADECTSSGITMLQRAIELKRCRVVEALLNAGASLFIRQNDGSTPLGCAMARSDEKILSAIVSGAGGMNSMSFSGESMLSIAVKGDYNESALILLKMKADPAEKNGYGKTAAEIARESGKLEMLRYFEDTDIVNVLSGIDEIIDKSMVRKNLISAEIEFRGAGGKTALMDAIEKNQTLRIKYLLVNGANAKAADGSGKTVHQYALSNGGREVANLIGLYCTIKPSDAQKIERGKDYVSVTSSSSVTFVFQPKTEKDMLNQELLSALRLFPGPGFDKIGQIKAVIEKGADVNYAIPPDGTTPLMEMIKQFETDIVKMLIEKGANVNAVDKNSRGAFWLACDSQNINIIKLLVDNGLDLKSAGGREGFVHSAFLGNIEIIKFLIEKGADVNAKNGHGITAPIMAVMGSKTGVVKFLIEKGADISIKDPSGKTAADYAASSGNKALIELLKK